MVCRNESFVEVSCNDVFQSVGTEPSREQGGDKEEAGGSVVRGPSQSSREKENRPVAGRAEKCGKYLLVLCCHSGETAAGSLLSILLSSSLVLCGIDQ